MDPAGAAGTSFALGSELEGTRDGGLTALDGGLAATYVGDRQAWVQRLDEDLTPSGAALSLGGVSPNGVPPALAVDGALSVVFVRQELDDGGVVVSASVRVARVMGSGTPASSAISTELDGYAPDADRAGDELAVVWQRNGLEPIPGTGITTADVVLARASATGAWVSEELVLSVAPAGIAFGGRVQVVGDAAFVTWQQWDPANEYRGFLQRIPLECLASP